MSEENKMIEEDNKEVETSQETISDEAMSNIKDSSTWIDALLVVVYLLVISYSIFLLWIIAFAQFIFKTNYRVFLNFWTVRKKALTCWWDFRGDWECRGC